MKAVSSLEAGKMLKLYEAKDGRDFKSKREDQAWLSRLRSKGINFGGGQQ